MDDYVPPVQSAVCYNGASHDKFTWSQSINDLDVLVNIPDSLTSPNDLKVNVTTNKIKVEIRKNLIFTDVEPEYWYTLFEGELKFSIKPHDTIWSMTSGKYVNVIIFQ